MAAWDAEEKLCLVQALRDLARENASLRDDNATEAERFFKASSMRKKANSKGLEKERNEENNQECKQTSLIIVSCKFGERFFMFQVAYAETIVLDQASCFFKRASNSATRQRKNSESKSTHHDTTSPHSLTPWVHDTHDLMQNTISNLPTTILRPFLQVSLHIPWS